MKIHTIQLNIEDFEAGTAYMDATEKGAYISLLICLYKVSNHQLKNDDARLARMACVSPRIWRKIKHTVLEKFIVKKHFLVHERVQKEVVKYTLLSQKNKANSLKIKETAKPLGKPLGKPNPSQTQANISNYKLSPNNNSIKKEIYKEKIYPQEFLDIWKVYPKLRRGNKQKGLNAFQNALKRDSLENINIGIQNYIDSDEAKGQYAKGFAAWFNDDRWLNDYTTKGKNNGKFETPDEATRRGTREVFEEICADFEKNGGV